MTPSKCRWPHSPAHVHDAIGTFIVTSATYKKQHFVNSPSKLDFVQSTLFSVAEESAAALQAWAIFSNHYHFIASLGRPAALASMIRKFHSITARKVNEWDRTPSRRIWFQYWDSKLSFEKSYFARLHYVHRNPVHHGLVRAATQYPWCSAAWFEREAPRSFQQTIFSVPCDTVRVPDGFDVLAMPT
jgi:putative transposase